MFPFAVAGMLALILLVCYLSRPSAQAAASSRFPGRARRPSALVDLLLILALVVVGYLALSSGTLAFLFHNLWGQQTGGASPSASFSQCQEPPTQASYHKQEYMAYAQGCAHSFNLAESLFLKQITQESGWQPTVVSSAGAIGIAQFMPATAKSLGIDPHNPFASLKAAASLMARYVHQDYQGDYAKALAAYNAGPGAVSLALARGGSQWRAWLPRETQAYLQSILGDARR